MTFAFGGLVATPAARASSIVYTKGSNIWIADADGSNQYQVTTDENFTYSSPSDQRTTTESSLLSRASTCWNG